MGFCHTNLKMTTKIENLKFEIKNLEIFIRYTNIL